MNNEEEIGSPISADLELTVLERLILTAFRFELIDADLAATSGEKHDLKCRDRDAEVMRAISLLRTLPADLPSWAAELRDSVNVNSREQVYEAFRAAADFAGDAIWRRPRALMVLIDVVVFDPWSGKGSWKASARDATLQAIAGRLECLEARDLATVQREHSAAIREVRIRSAKLGDFTVATLAKLPESVNETLTSGAQWLKSFDTDAVEAAVRVDLMTRLVAVDAEHDVEKAKRVVQSMQERLAVVVEMQEALTAKLRDARRLNKLLSSENRELRRQLEEERERAQVAEAALRTALDHIFVAVPALPAATGTV